MRIELRIVDSAAECYRVLQSAHNRRLSGDDGFGHVVADLLALAIRE